jgi:hypothetical protein
MSSSSSESTTNSTTKSAKAKPDKGYARISPFYIALIWTSFLINALLLIIVATLAGLLWNQQRQVYGLVDTTRSFAGYNVAELQDVVNDLQDATIVYTVPLDTRLPIEIDVPINEQTIVTLTEPVPLSVPAAILFPGGGGNLNANVNITLPQGLPLAIQLDFSVPLRTSVPVVLDVPVNIPLRETELGPQFARLGAVVERLVAPAEPLLLRPDQIPDSSVQQEKAAPMAAPEAPAQNAPAGPIDPNAPPTVTPGNPGVGP